MIRRILLGLLLVGLIAVIYVGYKHWSERRAMYAGDVTVGPSEPLPGVSSSQPSAPRFDTPSQSSQTQPQNQPLNQTQAQSEATSNPPSSTKSAPAVPIADSQAPEAPNGLRFAGSGRYEVYRQGNLTYRIDTSTGKSCVLYATKEEWRKPEVYRHGCGSSAIQ